jgi:quinoprotein glucose dehydrogenase
LIDFTPELHAKALELIKRYKVGPIFTPPALSKVEGPLSTLEYDASAGTNWTGGAFDPETHTVYVPAAPSLVSLHGLVVPPPGFSDEKYLGGTAGQPFIVQGGAGAGAASDAPKQSAEDAKLAAILAQSAAAKPVGPPPTKTVDSLPLVKPPYGTITAINMDTGDFRWQIAHGDTPDEIRNNPALKGLTIPKTGQQGNVGILVTKTVVVSGDPLASTSPGHPRGAYLHAYDKMTGAEVGRVWMPAPQSGSPMTYSYGGKQYIVVAVSGGNYSGEYIAYRLPSGN